MIHISIKYRHQVHLLSSVLISIIDTCEEYQYRKSLIDQYWYIYCRKSHKTFYFPALHYRFQFSVYTLFEKFHDLVSLMGLRCCSNFYTLTRVFVNNLSFHNTLCARTYILCSWEVSANWATFEILVIERWLFWYTGQVHTSGKIQLHFISFYQNHPVKVTRVENSIICSDKQSSSQSQIICIQIRTDPHYSSTLGGTIFI